MKKGKKRGGLIPDEGPSKQSKQSKSSKKSSGSSKNTSYSGLQRDADRYSIFWEEFMPKGYQVVLCKAGGKHAVVQEGAIIPWDEVGAAR